MQLKLSVLNSYLLDEPHPFSTVGLMGRFLIGPKTDFLILFCSKLER